MANNLVKNKAAVQEIPGLALQQFTGLSLKLDFTNRDHNSWQTLDNFDLYIPGSLRKVLPAILYGGPYGANILNCLEYLAQANNPAGGIRRLLGVGADGEIYNLASLTPTTPYVVANYLIGNPTTIPTILQFPGFFVPFNIRTWTKNTVYALNDAVLEYGPDGIIYVFRVTLAGTTGTFEPIWPVNGSVSENGPSPAWNVALNGLTTDGGITWINLGQPAWTPSTVYALNSPIKDSNGNIQIAAFVNPPGTSGTIQPAWSVVLNGLTPDNGANILWKCLTNPMWQPSHAYPLSTLIIDSNGNIQRVNVAGTSMASGGVTWTNVGVPDSNRFFAYFLAIFSPGTQPIRLVEWQYDPTDGTELPKITVGQMGCSPATVPPELGGITTTPNLNGYAPSAGRAYQWTYYNPQTLQESSPSPFVGKTKIVEVDNSELTVTINGSILVPLPQTTKVNTFTSYQSFYIAIPVSVLVPFIGQGYTTIRIYATQDGGTVFFLVNTLYDNNGNSISNSDGSIPIALLKQLSITNSWTDYFPIPEPQNLVPSVRIYEGSGPVNFAPDPCNLGPDAWFLGFGTAIFVIEGGAPDGCNAATIDGTAAPFASNTFRSNNFRLTPNTYFFQAFIDNSQASSGNAKAQIRDTNGTIYATLSQPPGSSGVLSTTFTIASSHTVHIRFVATGVTVPVDGAIVWANPLLEIGSVLNPIPISYPTTDDSLSIPAPLPFANNPPPITRSAEAFLASFIMVDHADPSKYWYTQQGRYELVGANSFVRTTTNVGTAIMQLVRMLDTLVIFKERSMEQVTTYPPTNPTAIDPQHGALSYRAGIAFGAGMMALMTHGLGRMSLAQALGEAQAIDASFQAALIGDDIKPLIDRIDPTELHAQNLTTTLPSPAILNALNLYLLAFRSTGIFP